MEHWAKKIFQKNHPKTSSKHVWTLLGSNLGISEFWKFFDFFESFRRLDPPWNTGQKNFFKKITLKHLQNTFGHFWDRIWAFRNFENFLIFLKVFEDSTLHGTLGKMFFGKITPKLVQNTLGHFLERFWAFLGFWIFFWFWKFSFGHFWGRFWAFLDFWNFFDFFEKIRRLDPPWNTGQKKFLKKITLKHLQNTFGHFWERFWSFLEFWKILDFLKNFNNSTLLGTLGKKFFRKSHPKTSSKHVWTLLGSNLGIFGILKNFWFFWKFSKTRPSIEHWAKIFFGKINPKLVQNTFGQFWERFWAFLEFWIFFWFWNFSFGHFWGRFWAFWKFETFLIFLKKFQDSTLHGTLGKKFFWKKHPKTSSKHVWTLLGSSLGIFGILKIFWFFWKFSKTRPSMEHWAKFFSEKLPLNLFKTRWDTFWNDFGLFWNFEFFFDFENFRLDTFGDDFGHFWIFWNFFDFFEKNRRLDPPWNTGQKKFFKKITLKHLQNTFGHFWERFWSFLEFWKSLDFFENFQWLDPPWNTGQKNFSKKLPQNMFKTRLDTFGDDFGRFWNFETFLIFFENFRLDILGTILGYFGTLKLFWLFWNFSKTRPSMEHWAKSFFERITLKHLQNTFGHFWDRIWAFLEFWKFFDFFESFRKLDPPSNTGKNFFSKWLTLNLFKTRLDTFGNDFGLFWNFEIFFDFEKFRLDIFVDDFGHFGILKFFWFFWKKSKTRPSMEHWAKNYFWKEHPKTSSKHVWTLLGSNLGIFGILKIFWFCGKFSKTRPSKEHWAKKFFEKITPKLVQNTLGHFLGRFWAFLEFWNFFWFWKISFGHFWGRFWAFLDFWNFFDFFETFRRLDPPWNTRQKIFLKKSP